jgi:hypothetical protein
VYARVKSGAYRALPSRRSYIPKEDGSKRPLAVMDKPRNILGTIGAFKKSVPEILAAPKWGQDTKVHFMPLSGERTGNIAFAGSIHGAWV